MAIWMEWGPEESPVGRVQQSERGQNSGGKGMFCLDNEESVRPYVILHTLS